MAGKSNEWNFEEISEDEVRGVPRGRKSNVDPALVDALKTLKSGRAIRIGAMGLDPKATNYKTDKARVSATIRSAMKSAGHAKFSIVWSPEGVPQVKVG
jgi:hypothetical protein